MNKTIKKVLIGVVTIAIVFVVYLISILAYFSSGCGFDDGPFEGQLIEPIAMTQSAQKFELDDNKTLIIDNRDENQSPVIMLIDNGQTKWAFDTDISHMLAPDQSAAIYQINNVKVSKFFSQVTLEFIVSWTGGTERGSMEINLNDGGNEFCLSW